MKKNRLLLLVIVLLTLMLSGCANEDVINEDLLNINYEVESNETKLLQYETDNPVVALYIEKYGSVVIELYPDIAPNTVNNFIYLVKKGFYDNNTFHRLIPDFVLQGGDPTGIGSGGPGYQIKGEFIDNNFQNKLRHTKGIVSMARTSDSNDTAGSQFFIMLDEAEHLDGYYAAFGKVIDGWENVEKIVQNEIVLDKQSGKLRTNLKLKKAIIDQKGKEYPKPEKITEKE